MTWTKVGKIKGAHGLKGEVELLVFSKDTSWAKKLNEVSLSLIENENPKIYEVRSIRSKTGFLLLTLDTISDRNQAEALIGKLVSISSKLLISKKGETIFLSEILNFKVINRATNQDLEIGTITSFSSNGIQDLLVVTQGERSSEIPFVEPFIEKIDYESKVIYMILPEGLIEV